MKEIPKRYNPEKYEESWADFWVKEKIFSSSPDNRPPYSIVIPPPNVTGVLHMGHALNNVLQDIIIRFHKILNYNVMWMPGTDHGGIATQNVVEKLLFEEGKTRHDLGREKFLEKMWQWKEESGGTIIKQLKRIGCGCDWGRLRFTMDEKYSRSVKEAFVRLFNKGFIYRGEYIINWCPRCETALSDIEVEHEEKETKLWHIKYPLKGSDNEFIVVATTRPETMLGDTAVAVNPDDERYIKYIGEKVILPVTGREIEVIADEFVDPEFGTGMVKVTPAHDPNDFEMGKRHDLPVVKVIDEKGRMTVNAGEFAGMDRFECRKKLLEKLDKEDLLKKEEKYTHSVGECYRCSSIIEPLVSLQWFVKMKELASKALEVSKKNKIEFVPERWKKPYLNWLENIHDWCISRQIWWGHRIPVYYCEEGDCPPIASEEEPEKCPSCGGKVKQDEDVLDTWFSSGLWPFATLNWPDGSKDLDYYYPTKVLVTGHEILYLWVARMVMMGLEMMEEIPFDKVNIHGIIRDEKGLKMSKSKGNVIDPIEIIEKYGTDALRFALAKSAVPGRDIQLSDDDFIGARNFCNKIWNATRLILSNIEIKKLKEINIEELDLADKWIIHETAKYTGLVKEAYSEFNNAKAARLFYEFIWSYFCDWYLELAKLRLYNKKPGKETAELVLLHVLKRVLNIIHPVMPFISSQLWEYLKEEIEMPAANPLEYNGFEEKLAGFDSAEIRKMEILIAIVSGIRNIRGQMDLPPSVKLKASVKTSEEQAAFIIEHSDYIKLLAGLDEVTAGPDISKSSEDTLVVVEGISVFLALPKKLRQQEVIRLEKRIKEVKEQIHNSKRKLRNRDFLEKAPDEVVKMARQREEKFESELQKLEKNLQEIKK